MAFLKRISRILHREYPALPDLRTLEHAGQIVLIPIGGSNVVYWTHRLAGLRLPEFHLYDLESEPVTSERRAAVAMINRRPGCVAFLTSKRSLENYLHPAAIREARGLELDFGDWDDVPDLTAERLFLAQHAAGWQTLGAQTRRRLRNRAKEWLNREAVERMTVPRLAARDPAGDLIRWLTTIAGIVR
jgi:hypothetical protein